MQGWILLPIIGLTLRNVLEVANALLTSGRPSVATREASVWAGRVWWDTVILIPKLVMIVPVRPATMSSIGSTGFQFRSPVLPWRWAISTAGLDVSHSNSRFRHSPAPNIHALAWTTTKLHFKFFDFKTQSRFFRQIDGRQNIQSITEFRKELIHD